MSIETRLKALEKSAPAARHRPEGMNFDDYVSLMCAALEADPNAGHAWIGEMTLPEVVQLQDAVERIIAGRARTADRAGHRIGKQTRNGCKS